jgi:RHS repeat-associated protein
VRFVVDADTAEVVQQLDYDAYGQVVLDTQPTDPWHPFGFAGGLYDADTGLVRFGARDYDPTLGRWTTQDPIGLEGGLHLYEYAGGDPVNYVDPSGLSMESWGIEGELTKSLPGPTSDLVPAALDWFVKTFISDYESPIDYILVFAGPVGKLAKWGVKALKVADNVADDSPIVNVVAHTDDCAKASKVVDGAEGARQGGLNLFKWGDETSTTATGWKEGDRFLHLPNKGSPKANWKENAGRLREEMGKGEPIYDSYLNPVTGAQVPTGGFLNAES